jgi:pyruvate/2-oxoglutarate dehydrogenase complex dihydrolipoamide dehydrogenase (E3) component
MHTWVRIGEDRTHMITFYFDLNGTTIKWGCVRNKILKNTAHSETAAPHTNHAAAEEKKKKKYST